MSNKPRRPAAPPQPSSGRQGSGRSTQSSRNRQGPGGSRPAGRPTAQATGGTAQRAGWRRSLERVSAPWLVRLHRSPRWLVPVLLAVFLFTGLLLSGDWAWLGAILLGIVALFVAWLSALSWPVLTPGARLARVLVSGALLGVTALKAMGRM